MSLRPESVSVPVPVSGDTVAFIVRIWFEAVEADGAVTVWRGSVERVARPNQRVFFSDLDSIAAYIRRETGLAGQLTPDA
ncbi:MAG: hypothetical protein KA764_16430 [Anaerolineales bacterium]|nr:hypothetical protein [Anaerolineales bacterium]